MIARPYTPPPSRTPSVPATTSQLPSGSRRSDSVAVVGAGPGGLAAALQLAAAGLDVTIYEAQPEIGGRSRRIMLGDFAFDCGPTFFMMPWVLEEIVATCGSTLSELVELTRLDPMYRLLLGRTGAAPISLDTTQDLAMMRSRIEAIEPRDGAAFDRFISDNRAKLAKLTPVLRRPIRGVRDLMNVDGLRAGLALRPWRSVADELARRFKDPHVRLALAFQSKYLGMSPYECPELFTILPFIEYEYGIWHPTGGCSELFRALAALCRSMGVEIRCGAPVERILFEGRRARGVVVAGEPHAHDHVVVNADAAWALKHLIPESLRMAPEARGGRAARMLSGAAERLLGRSRSRMLGLGPLAGVESDADIDARPASCSTFMLYLGVRGELPLPHHTIYTSAAYPSNLQDISTHGRLSPDPSMYCCHASATDATLAPRGSSSLYVLVPVPNAKPGFSKIDWAVEAPRLREKALDQLEHVFGIGDLRGRIEAERIVTPLDWRAERINHGAAFNLSHTYGQMLHCRPRHKLPTFEGVWLVGGGTHPGSGLPVIFLSSTITTRLLCAELDRPHPMDEPLPPPRYARPRESHVRKLSADPGAPLAPVTGVDAGRT